MRWTALALALLASPAAAQVNQQSLCANCVVGRLGIGPGPTQAIPFATLSAQLTGASITLNSGNGQTAPGLMTGGGTYSFGATTDTPRMTGLGLGGVAPATGLKLYNAAVLPGAGGQSAVGADSTNGGVLLGQGSLYDASIQNKSGAVALGVPTGTQSLVLPNPATVGTVGGSLCATSAGLILYESGVNCFATSGIVVAGGKTVTFNNTLTFNGTDATTFTYPTSNATLAGLGTTQTFTGSDTFSGTLNCTGTCQLNGTAFGTFATANSATPPAIGGTSPAAGSFTTLTATTPVGLSSGGTNASTAAGARASGGLNIDEFTPHGDSNYSILSTDRTVGTSSGLTAPRTWTLPLASTVNAGQTLLVQDVKGFVSNTNTLTIARGGSDTINGGTGSQIINSANGGFLFISDGVSNWSAQALGAQAASGVASINGQTGNPSIIAGTGISVSTSGGNISVINTGVTGAAVNAKAVGASGSSSTTTGTISASSPTLALASAVDFANGQGIRVDHAGATFTPGQPSSLTVTPTGTTGATAYQYTIASIDANGGVGAAITAVSISNGNATLSNQNYNALSWSAGSGSPTGYAVYGNKSGSLQLLAIVGGTAYDDTGLNAPGSVSAPDWLPATPPVSALADYLVTTVSAGGGTTTLTLGANATNSATSQNVLHDDTTALQSAITTADNANLCVDLGAGTYRTSSALAANSNNVCLYGQSVSSTVITLASITQDGIDSSTTGRMYLHDFAIGGNSGGVFNLGGSLLNISGHAADIYSHVRLFNCWNGMTNSSVSWVAERFDGQCSSTVFNLTSVGDSTITHSYIQPLNVPGFTSAIGVQDTGDIGGLRVVNNKFNGGPYTAGISATTSVSDGDFIVVGNSIEGWTTGGIIIAHSGSVTFNNIAITGNQIAGGSSSGLYGNSGRAIYFSDSSNAIGLISIVGNVTQAILNDIVLNANNNFVIEGNTLTQAGTGILVGASSTGCVIGTNTFASSVTTQVNDASGICVSSTRTTAFLGGNVSISSTASYFDGPTVNVGTVGTWCATATVVVTDSVASNFRFRLWDGTTVIKSAQGTEAVAGGWLTVTLSGCITNPAASLRMSVKDINDTTGSILFNATGDSKDSSIEAYRIN